MKLIKILILLIVFTSFFPLDGICSDHHMDVEQGHHCVLVCHTCHQMVSPETAAATPILDQSTNIPFNYSFQYQTPVLDRTHRPPIVSL